MKTMGALCWTIFFLRTFHVRLFVGITQFLLFLSLLVWPWTGGGRHLCKNLTSLCMVWLWLYVRACVLLRLIPSCAHALYVAQNCACSLNSCYARRMRFCRPVTPQCTSFAFFSSVSVSHFFPSAEFFFSGMCALLVCDFSLLDTHILCVCVLPGLLSKVHQRPSCPRPVAFISALWHRKV